MECEVCGQTFAARPVGKNRFCSRQCTGIWRRGEKWGTDRHARRSVVCEQCGEEFMSRIDSAGRFCSRLCSGRWHSGTRNGFYKGGLCTKKDGRTVINCRDRSLVYFYRAVAEAMLGRELLPGEVVHHVDGDHSNDDPANLVVMSVSEHTRLHQEQGDLDISGLLGQRALLAKGTP